MGPLTRTNPSHTSRAAPGDAPSDRKKSTKFAALASSIASPVENLGLAAIGSPSNYDACGLPIHFLVADCDAQMSKLNSQPGRPNREWLAFVQRRRKPTSAQGRFRLFGSADDNLSPADPSV